MSGYKPYVNRSVKTPAKTIGRIAQDIVNERDNFKHPFDVNVFKPASIVNPPPLLLHIDTVDPTVNDDINAGYEIGTIWINTVNDTIFICTDETIGAALWIEVCCGGGISVTASMPCPKGLTIVDLGAIPDEAWEHDFWVKIVTLDGFHYAESRPRAPQLGGVTAQGYKEAGNFKLRVYNDSGTVKTMAISYT